MTWEERELPVLTNGSIRSSCVRFEAGDVCTVEVLVDNVCTTATGSDLFEALAVVRGQLFERDIIVMCNGARRDVFPSQMLRQATSGRRAYVLRVPRGRARPPIVDIFDPAPKDAVFDTVDGQYAAFQQWVASEISEGGAS